MLSSDSYVFAVFGRGMDLAVRHDRYFLDRSAVDAIGLVLETSSGLFCVTSATTAEKT